MQIKINILGKRERDERERGEGAETDWGVWTVTVT